MGSDLNCNNNFLVINDEPDEIVFRQWLISDLPDVLSVRQRSAELIVGITVEWTFNWLAQERPGTVA